MADRFEQFTERARKVLTLAQEESQRFNHKYIGTEHLLIALLREKDGVAGQVLAKLGLEVTSLRSRVEAITGRGERAIMGEIGLTPPAKQTVDQAIVEARSFNHNYIGTEHLLLSLLNAKEGTALDVLENLGIALETIREQVIAVINQPGYAGSSLNSTSEPVVPTQGEFAATEHREAAATASDRFEKFTERARKVLTLAQEEAQRFNHNYIGTEHLLLGLVREGDGVAARVLHSMGVELHKVRSGVEFIIGRGARGVTGEIGMTPRSKKVIELAVDEARRLNHHYIGTEHILLGLIREGEGIAAGVLNSLGVSLDNVRLQVMQILTQSTYSASAPSSFSTEPKPLENESSESNLGSLKRIIQRILAGGDAPLELRQVLSILLDSLRQEKLAAMSARNFQYSSSLAELERNLLKQMFKLNDEESGHSATRSSTRQEETGMMGVSLVERAKAGELDPLVGREHESERLLQILSRRHHPHALLVGKSGVGKAAIVRGLAHELSRGLPPTSLPLWDVLWLDLSDFVTFITKPGELAALLGRKKQPLVLFMTQFNRLVEFANSENCLIALYDFINHPGVRLVGTTTPAGYERIRHIDETLAHRFQLIQVAETDETATLEILRGVKLRYEQHYNLQIEDSAIEIALALSQKYVSGSAQPSKALDLLDEACSLVAVRRSSGSSKTNPTEGEEQSAPEKDAKQQVFESLVTDYNVVEVVAENTGKSIAAIRQELN